MTTPSIDVQPLRRLSWAWLTLVSTQLIDPLALDVGDLDSWRRIGIEVNRHDKQVDQAAVQLYLDLVADVIAYDLQRRLVPAFDGAAKRVAGMGEVEMV